MARGRLQRASLNFGNPSSQEGSLDDRGPVSSMNTSSELLSRDRIGSPWLMYLRANKYISLLVLCLLDRQEGVYLLLFQQAPEPGGATRSAFICNPARLQPGVAGVTGRRSESPELEEASG